MSQRSHFSCSFIYSVGSKFVWTRFSRAFGNGLNPPENSILIVDSYSKLHTRTRNKWIRSAPTVYCLGRPSSGSPNTHSPIHVGLASRPIKPDHYQPEKLWPDAALRLSCSRRARFSQDRLAGRLLSSARTDLHKTAKSPCCVFKFGPAEPKSLFISRPSKLLQSPFQFYNNAQRCELLRIDDFRPKTRWRTGYNHRQHIDSLNSAWAVAWAACQLVGWVFSHAWRGNPNWREALVPFLPGFHVRLTTETSQPLMLRMATHCERILTSQQKRQLPCLASQKKLLVSQRVMNTLGLTLLINYSYFSVNPVCLHPVRWSQRGGSLAVEVVLWR